MISSVYLDRIGGEEKFGFKITMKHSP